MNPDNFENWFSADLTPEEEAALHEALRRDPQLRSSYEAHQAFERALRDAALRSKIKRVAAQAQGGRFRRLVWVGWVPAALCVAALLWYINTQPQVNNPQLTPQPVSPVMPDSSATEWLDTTRTDLVPAVERQAPVIQSRSAVKRKSHQGVRGAHGPFAHGPHQQVHRPNYRSLNTQLTAADSLLVDRAFDQIMAYNPGSDLDSIAHVEFKAARLHLLNEQTNAARLILFKWFDVSEPIKQESEWLLALTFAIEGHTATAKSAFKRISEQGDHKYAGTARAMLDKL